MPDKLRTKVIVNPAAGSGATARRWGHIKRQLDGLEMDYEYVLTEAPGHAIDLAAEAATGDFQSVVAVGGDGTINEVVNGLLRQTPSGVPSPIDLGIINTGTGSDFVRSLGIPRNPDRACHHLLSRQRLRVDAGIIEWVDGDQDKVRYFVNAAGVGFDAETASAKARISRLLKGPVSYALSVGTTLLGYKNRSVSVRCDQSAEKINRVLSVIIANGSYFGGGMKVAPDAELGDQLFDVLTIGDIGKIELIQAFPRVYRGTHITHPKVSVERAATITLSSTERLLLQADGEIIGEGAFRLSLLPGALNVII